MNIALWTLQALLALWNIMGGSFMVVNKEKLGIGAAQPWPLPLLAVHGGLQVLLAIGLLTPKAAPYAAAALAVLMLVDAFFPMSAQYEGFPGLLWPLIPGLLAAFLAYGRLVLLPFQNR